MTAYILLAIVAYAVWKHYQTARPNHISNPMSVPCPVCLTACVPGMMGFYRCDSCTSHWASDGAWVSRFRCNICGEKPVRIQQDFYNNALFMVEFQCGRKGTYHHETKAKVDIVPCRVYTSEQMRTPEAWTTPETENVTQPTNQESYPAENDDFFPADGPIDCEPPPEE